MNWNRREYVSNLHVHTTFSDGTGTIGEVIDAAKKAGLDILLITDHDTLKGREKGYEGYHGDLLVIIGFEISGPYHHYLVWGMDYTPKYNWRKPQDFVNEVATAGGIGVAAHPFEKGSPMSDSGHAFTWKDWSVNGIDGLEIWNHSSAWKMKARDMKSAVYHLLTRTGTLAGPDEDALAKWDELGKTRRIAGVGGSDAHAFKAHAGPFTIKIFPYEFMFRSINTHLLLPDDLTGDVEDDKAAVIKALAGGSAFTAHDRLSSSRGFQFHLEKKNGDVAGQGMETSLDDGGRLTWRTPVEADVRIIRDGEKIYGNKSDAGELSINEPGVYRLEACVRTRLFGWRPWIYSNPVYVRP